MRKVYFSKFLMVGVFLLFGFSSNLMAQQPASNPAPKTIFDFQKEIGLSDQQMDSIKQIIEDIQKTFAEKAEELQKMREVLSGMIQDKKDLKMIRKQFEKIATVQVDSSMKDIEASRKIENLMNKEQFNIWKNIQTQMTQESLERMRAQQEQEK